MCLQHFSSDGCRNWKLGLRSLHYIEVQTELCNRWHKESWTDLCKKKTAIKVRLWQTSTILGHELRSSCKRMFVWESRKFIYHVFYLVFDSDNLYSILFSSLHFWRHLHFLICLHFLGQFYFLGCVHFWSCLRSSVFLRLFLFLKSSSFSRSF